MEIDALYELIKSHLDNGIPDPQEKMGKLKRVKLPIPKEYGGGVVTGYGWEETVRHLIERVRDQIKMESNAPTFQESWEQWIKIKEGQKKAPSTIANYRYIARVHLIPFFGEKKVDQITSDDIQTYYNTIMDKSKSISTQSQAILKGIFNRAVRMGDISKNVMLYEYDKSKKKGEKIVLQDTGLLDAISGLNVLKENKDIRDYLYFCFLCFTALRRGEILGLKWSDIDFENDTIHVRTNVTFPNGQNEPVIWTPKDESFGTVHLHSELKRYLQPYQKTGYIVPYSLKESNRPITKSMFVKIFARIKKVVNLQGATSHSFRSSYATMMNAHCDHVDPKVLQQALRHKTPDLAIKVYTKENTDKTRIAEMEYDQWLTSQMNGG